MKLILSTINNDLYSIYADKRDCHCVSQRVDILHCWPSPALAFTPPLSFPKRLAEMGSTASPRLRLKPPVPWNQRCGDRHDDNTLRGTTSPQLIGISALHRGASPQAKQGRGRPRREIIHAGDHRTRIACLRYEIYWPMGAPGQRTIGRHRNLRSHKAGVAFLITASPLGGGRRRPEEGPKDVMHAKPPEDRASSAGRVVFSFRVICEGVHAQREFRQKGGSRLVGRSVLCSQFLESIHRCSLAKLLLLSLSESKLCKGSHI